MSIYIEDMCMPSENDYIIVTIYGDGVVTEYSPDPFAKSEKTLGHAYPILDNLKKDYKEKILNKLKCEKCGQVLDITSEKYDNVNYCPNCGGLLRQGEIK